MTNKTIAYLVGRADWNPVNCEAKDWTFPLPNQYVGVELEVDCDNSTRDITVFPDDSRLGFTWSKKHDGSLAFGYEYVLRSPLCGKALADAVYSLFSGSTSVHRTYTGSTHIHLDMTDGVPVEALRTLVLLAYSFETYLYGVGDITRQWCGYANRLTAAPSDILEAVLGDDDLSRFNRSVESAGRYYGLNLNALSKYGSIEFRYFPTAESPEELLSWVNLCQKFKKAALEIGTVDNLIATLNHESGYNEMLATFFTEEAERIKELCPYSRVRGLMQKALIIARATTAEPTSYQMRTIGARFTGLLSKYGYVHQEATVSPAAVQDGVNIHFLAAGNNPPRAQDYTYEATGVYNVLVRYSGDVFVAVSHPTYGDTWFYMETVREQMPDLYNVIERHYDDIVNTLRDNESSCNASATVIVRELFRADQPDEDDYEYDEFFVSDEDEEDDL